MLLFAYLNFKKKLGYYQILKSFLVLNVPVFFFCYNLLAQQTINSSGVAVTQNFDGIGNLSTATLPTGWKMGTDWSSGETVTTRAAGTTGPGVLSSSSAGGFYNFANGVTASSTDRAIGFLTSGSYSSPRSIIYAFTNNTGNTISSLTVSWDYEKYRSGSRAFDWTFFHGASPWPLSPSTAGNQSYSADGGNTTISNPPLSTSKSVNLSGLSITNGSTYYLRWTYSGSGGSSNGQGLGVDNFSITLGASCTSPTALSFLTQPSIVLQNATMSSAVQVAAVCADNTIATGYTGTVTLTVNATGCGYLAQTVSFVNGIGTFNSIIFTRSPQSNLTFTATSSGLTSATSSPFNVNAPAGAPTVSTIIQNNFDAIQTWGYSVGTAISVGSGGSAGFDVVGIVTEAGTGVLRKSFSVNNTSGQQGSKNTITFDNVSGLSPYSSIDFTFNVLSFGSGSGAGNDSGEDFSLDVSTDNGATWTTVLFQYGFSNRLFPQSASPVTSLSLSSITYAPPTASSGPDTRSAFLLTLTGISQFCFRFTAQNNRSEENWAIDNPKLTGTTYGVGVPFNLPSVNLGSDFQFCFGNSAQLSSTVTSVLNPTTYSWTPSTWLNNVSIPNPTITGLTTSQIYSLSIIDADNCIASDQVLVSVLNSPSIIFLSPP